jgi:hypothetical protein
MLDVNSGVQDVKSCRKPTAVVHKYFAEGLSAGVTCVCNQTSTSSRSGVAFFLVAVLVSALGSALG